MYQVSLVIHLCKVIFLYFFLILDSQRTIDLCSKALSFHLENRCELRRRAFDPGQTNFRVGSVVEMGVNLIRRY